VASSYAPNPNFSFGVAPDGALCANAGCTAVAKVDIFGALTNEPTPYVYVYSLQTQFEPIRSWQATIGYREAEAANSPARLT